MSMFAVTLNVGWPQALVVAWVLLGLLTYVVKHGKPYTGNFNAYAFVLARGLLLWALVAGGFFNPACAQVHPAATAYRGDLTRAAHAQWGLDAPIPALAAQVHQESGWNPAAVSLVGAEGMAQFMPGTATWWCELNGLTKAECQPRNPVWALRALVGYDKYLFDRTPPRMSGPDRLWVALRAYNGGLGHWLAEAKVAQATTGMPQPSRQQVDAACGKARRAPVHCPENLGYPQRILVLLQPRYAAWGTSWPVGRAT